MRLKFCFIPGYERVFTNQDLECLPNLKQQTTNQIKRVKKIIRKILIFKGIIPIFQNKPENGKQILKTQVVFI